MAKRWLSFIGMTVAAWAVMVLAHELGHILVGWAGGGKLVRADLRPWALPHSLFAPDPYPLATLWGGPILGVAIPVVLALVISRRWAWFIADFCLIANGTYLALAGWGGEPHLDTPRLIAAGAAWWQIVFYCLVTIPIGYVRFRARCAQWLEGSGAVQKDIKKEDIPCDS